MHKLAGAAISLNFNFRNHTLNGRWGNKVDELDEILANGTDEEIEAALAGLDIDGDTLFGGEDGEKEPVVETKQETPVRNTNKTNHKRRWTMSGIFHRPSIVAELMWRH